VSLFISWLPVSDEFRNFLASGEGAIESNQVRDRTKGTGSLHYAIINGFEKRRIFETEKDRENFLNRLETVVIEITVKKSKRT